MEIGELIKERRKSKKLTLEEVGNRIGLSKVSVKKIEDGDIASLKSKYIMKLADVLDIDPIILLGGEPVNVSEDNFVRIPIVGNVACGKPTYTDDDIEGYEYHRKDNLPKGVPYSELTDIIADGNSMYPTILNGDIVTIQKMPTLENGDVGLFNIDESDATLKRFKKMGDQYLLMPDNTEYDPIIVTPGMNVRIVGKVVALNRRF